MAMTITEECINCGACEPECPQKAIAEDEELFVIDPGLCDECKDLDGHPCVDVCPVECIVEGSGGTDRSPTGPPGPSTPPPGGPAPLPY